LQSVSPLVLADGQVMDDLSIAMYHGGAITGRVIDAHGDRSNTPRRAPESLAHRGRPTMAGSAQANDLASSASRLEPARIS
jgi:hypothetical protein